nr:MAG TPA: hypothetical protein [Bacteriophage sp.]DAP43444.1 MAG TPA: hypothetical protein [Caudoviricetes sp.]DAR80400.1 MAG TPA: hypothetical protein [Caudoviricetes sp.]
MNAKRVSFRQTLIIYSLCKNSLKSMPARSH